MRVIGVQVDAIERGEDRQAFKDTMNRLGIDMPRSEIARSLEEAEEVLQRIGLPAVIRPAYTMGGTGGGLVFNMQEFRTVVQRGLPPAWSARSSWKNRSRAGRNWSWKSSATPRTR